jgi:hypothetical protein
MFEHHHQPLISRAAFHRRLASSFLIALAIVAGSLILGVLGYRFWGGLPWIDALLNASMILAGMGPTSELTTAGAKLFASFYALFSGLALLTTVSILMAPFVHRFMHKFHLPDERDD